MIRFTYGRPSKGEAVTWLLLALAVCTLYGGFGVIDGFSSRDELGTGGAQAEGAALSNQGRDWSSSSARTRRGGNRVVRYCSSPHFRRSERQLRRSTEAFIRDPAAPSHGGSMGQARSLSRLPLHSCNPPSTGDKKAQSPEWRNANLMFNSVLVNGRSTACANASLLVPFSIRRDLLRQMHFGDVSPPKVTSQSGGRGGGPAPLLRDGAHCLTPLGRFFLHFRPNQSTTNDSDDIHGGNGGALYRRLSYTHEGLALPIPSLHAAVASSVAGALGPDTSGSDAIADAVESAISQSLVVGGSSEKNAGSSETVRRGAAVLYHPEPPGVTLNRRLLVQLLGVEVRGWLRALFPERLSHISTELASAAATAEEESTGEVASRRADTTNSPIRRLITNVPFVINVTQTLAEEEAAEWVPTTKYSTISTHQRTAAQILRDMWTRGDWGSKLKSVHSQTPPLKLRVAVQALEESFVASLDPDWFQQGHRLREKGTPTSTAAIAASTSYPPSLEGELTATNGDVSVYQGTPFTVLSADSPRAFKVGNILTPEHRAQLIQHAEQHMERSKVVNGGAAEGVNIVRTSYGMFVTDFGIPANAHLRYIGAKMTGLPQANIEATQILRYTEGQYYLPHPDYFGRGSPILKRGGERVATLLAWLNEVPQGGETKFPNSMDASTGKPVQVEPDAGSGVLFYNMKEDGSADLGSIHEAIPPIGGIKWVAVLWIREHRFT